tara:strand:- start:147 stop:443 length:297 start_codon:yes stop_codon:yes gene_type:complete
MDKYKQPSTLHQLLVAALPTVIDSLKMSYNLEDWERIEKVTYNLMNMTAYTDVPALKQAVYDFSKTLNIDRKLETKTLRTDYERVLKEAQNVIEKFKN